jgi:hypothetical protein
MAESPAAPDEAERMVERLVAQASRAGTTTARDGLYARASLRLYLHGEYESALDLAREIATASLAMAITEPIKFDRAGDLISRGDLEKGAVVARSLDRIDLRVSVLARIGSAYLAAKKPNEAVEILTEAESLAAKATPSVYLVSGMLGVAMGLIEISRDRGVSATYAAVRAANAISDGDFWDLVYAGQGPTGRLAAQNHLWSTRRDGGLESLSVDYPRLAGFVDPLGKISQRDLDEGLMIAQLLKQKAQSLALQALICREAIRQARSIKLRLNDTRKKIDTRREEGKK